MSVEIAPIAISHAESFHSCLDSVAREACFLAATKAPSLEKIEAFVSENVANDAIQFVALDDARVVGWADVLSPWPDAIAHRGTLGMGIVSEYRRQRIGERLLRACIEKALSKGITRIELETRSDNHPSIKLYEKLGFVHEAVKRRAMRFDGEYYDSVQMSLLL
jgi:RimJ/RimL family protein N-acetyltransferase